MREECGGVTREEWDLQWSYEGGMGSAVEV